MKYEAKRKHLREEYEKNREMIEKKTEQNREILKKVKELENADYLEILHESSVSVEELQKILIEMKKLPEKAAGGKEKKDSPEDMPFRIGGEDEST